ncbi:PPC domain-containing DNA-binding protein [Pseudodesulfovibrio sediminis]|uniref:PPC domain-containing protein n=1 Tax=Pseudodesulfovibrio sediminis TaxID=2810563 RepID=A0ABN6EP29_9BACT|nr:PPC domain-containing DNA-binding protein [Pseudodesulfovibrio sediminis]BCS86861.1 hypothetical protein PSDVSF_01030 [Pseudodesulfovibrio sediminis]
MSCIAVRLRPGQDLLCELERFVREQSIEAACVLTCVGSLTTAVLRYANQENAIVLEGHYEIVSLTGVLSHHGSHCHIALSDSQGRTVGAHVLEGCKIYTTAEIVLGVCPDVRFVRRYDSETGYPELEIESATCEEE